MKNEKWLRVIAPVLLFSALLFLTISCAQKQPELIPREILFGNPTKVAPRISPDGNYLAYLAPYEGVLNVWVKTIGQDDDKVVTKDDDRGIRRFFWAGDSRHIVYLQDVGGNENWRLYAVNLITDDLKDFTPYEEVQVQIVDRNKNYPNELLIGMNKRDARVHDVYHLDLKTGELEMIVKNPGTVAGWVTDADFKVRGALHSNPEGGFMLTVRENEDADWEEVLTWGSDDAMTSGPLCFTKDGKAMYMQDSRNANTGRLVKYDLESGDIEVVVEDPHYDVTNVMIHPDEYYPQAVVITRAKDEWTILDETIEADFEAIKKLEKGDFFVYNRDNADETWLVGFTKDNGPVKYFAFDRKTKKGTFLFDHRPELNEHKLAEMEPVSFTSRDGLTIHGYLTYPPGLGKTNLPVVLNVHGGPWARDFWGFNPEAQWIANRGYACLQINFRGSTGYGKEFVNASDKEWGAAMHDDLIDGVNWAIEQGIADPEKVAIYGGSYGGYAALVGATFTPDVFCCAVDIVGPSNLVTLIESVPEYWKPLIAIFHKRVGNPKTEKEFLESRSPLFKVDQIKIPMLIAQGANDPRVKQAEAEQIVAAMEEKGIDHEYMLFPDEGHGFAKPENRLKFYAAAEKFLAKHLGGRYEMSAEEAEAESSVEE